MYLTRLALAFGGATVALFVVNGVGFSMVPALGKWATAHYTNLRETPLVTYHLLGNLSQAFLLAYIYPLTYRGGSVPLEGVRFGVLMALIISVPHACHIYALLETTLARQAYPVLWTVFVNGIAGIVVAYIYGPSAESLMASGATA